MTALLEEDQASILPVSFVGLTQNWVQWFLKDFLKVKVRNRSNNRAFHPFNRVFAFSGPVEVHREATAHGAHDFKHGDMRHTFDWKTNPREVEAAAKDLLSSRLDQLSARTSKL